MSEEEAVLIPHNGNGRKKKPNMVVVGEQIKRGNGSIDANTVLLQSINSSLKGNTVEEKTKFSIANGLQDDDKVHHFTEYRKWDEVLQMNQLEMYIKLAPRVFGDTPRNREILKAFASHIDQHKRNMRSYNRKGEKAIVDILRADQGEVPEPSGWKKFTGVGK